MKVAIREINKDCIKLYQNYKLRHADIHACQIEVQNGIGGFFLEDLERYSFEVNRG